MDRAEHLQWCKDRAMEYVDRGDLNQACASFCSDMTKHTETANHPALKMMGALMFGGHLAKLSEMKKWILGFN